MALYLGQDAEATARVTIIITCSVLTDTTLLYTWPIIYGHILSSRCFESLLVNVTGRLEQQQMFWPFYRSTCLESRPFVHMVIRLSSRMKREVDESFPSIAEV
jgi:hypothetical protein